MSIEITLQVLGLLVSIVGLAVIWFQLRQSANSSKASLLISINRDLNSYHEVAIQIESGRDVGWIAKLSARDLERLLDYISYFEGLYLAFRRGLFTLQEVNDYFGGRFFRLAHNQDVQSTLLCNIQEYDDTFRPIFMMHRELVAYRKRRRLRPLFPSSPLDRRNYEIYETMTGARHKLRQNEPTALHE